MRWNEIRASYPEQWVLVEALDAHSEPNRRVVESMALLETFVDSPTAWKAYSKLHKENPQRELYIAHTSQPQLEIMERSWLGVRANK
jgi:hypothetical protein